MAGVDLAQVQGRQTTTDRITNNRPTTIPLDNRLDRMPNVQVTASMRDAARGDGQVQAVQHFLGMLDETKSSMVDLSNRQFADSEKKNAELAAQDSANGTPNADLMQRSDAYRMVIADGRVHRAILDKQATIGQQLTDFLVAGANADPTKGEHPPTLEDANAKFDELIKDVMLDKDGKPIDYGDPQANVTLYRAVAKLREGAMQNAADMIAQQEKSKAMDSIGSMAITEIQAGHPGAVESALQRATSLGIDMKTAKTNIRAAVLDAAIQSKDESIIQKVLFSTQADGKTPTWSAPEKVELQQAYTTFHNQWEHERQVDTEKKGNENMGRMLPLIMSGKLRMTPDMITDLINKGADHGGVNADQAQQLFSMQNAVDAKRQNEVSQARGNIQWAWSQSEHAHTLQQREAERQVLATKAMFLSGEINQPQAIAKLDSAYKSHDIGDEEYVATRSALMQMPSGKALINKTNAGNHFDLLNENLAQADSMVRRGGPNALSPQQWAVNRRKAQADFYSALISTGDPSSALQAALGNVWAHGPAIEAQVQKADHRASAVDLKTKLKNQMKDTQE
jgi:hypothetical protein